MKDLVSYMFPSQDKISLVELNLSFPIIKETAGATKIF